MCLGDFNRRIAPHESILHPARVVDEAGSSLPSVWRCFGFTREGALQPCHQILGGFPLSPRIAQTFLLALVASVLFLPQFAHAATPPGLVAAYSFDENTGTTVADASGHGNKGTISNATWTSTAKHGSALSFNGSNSVVTIQPSSSLALTTGTDLRGMGSLRPAPTPGWRSVIFKEQPQELVYALYANSDRGLSGRYRVHRRRRAHGVRLECAPDVDVDLSRRHSRRHERTSLRERHACLDRSHAGHEADRRTALCASGATVSGRNGSRVRSTTCACTTGL